MNVALRPKHLDILSICTGGAGLDLGVELAIPGARTVCMVEREAFAAAQLVSAMQAGHLAPAPIWSDARTFDGRRWRGCVDGLIGGIPCQPHSLAGKRLEREDPRDLWSTARRIIVQSGAWFVLIENVGGMLSSGGAERVWRDLHRLGFASEGGLFTAAEVGASHERERLFILAVADARCAERRALADGGRFSDRHAAGWHEGAGRTAEPSPDVSGVGQADAYGERLEGQRPDAGAVGRQDARRSAGLCDGTTLEHASRIGRGEGRPEPSLRSGRDSIASADCELAVANGSGQPRIRVGNSGRSGDADGLHAGRDADGCHPALFPPGPSDLSSWRHTLKGAPELEPAVRRVADGLASRLDVARVDRLRLLGNGVVPLAAAYAVRTLATRLAERGSAGAARLVRVMGEV